MRGWAALIALNAIVLGCTQDYDEFRFSNDSVFLSCGDGAAECSAQCFSSLSSENCGGCGNDCSAQGAGLVCVSGQCRCTQRSQCGEGSCDKLIGRCQCAGSTCQAGEACVRSDGELSCSCNGGAGCPTGQTCCQTPAGCRETENDPDNCGLCGRRCPPGQRCLLAVCRPET